MKKVLKICLILSLVCLLNSCKEGPKVTVCVSNPSESGFECYSQETKKSFFLKYEDSDKYVALSPADAQTLFNYCANNKNEDDIDSEVVQELRSKLIAQRKR